VSILAGIPPSLVRSGALSLDADARKHRRAAVRRNEDQGFHLRPARSAAAILCQASMTPALFVEFGIYDP